MKNKKVYLTKVSYSLFMGIFMGFIITSGFLVIITNIDKYFFNSFIGISGDWLYYTASLILVPLFGVIFVYNKRIAINDNVLELREKGLSLNISKMNVSSIKSISLHKQKSGRRNKLGIKFADGDTALMIYIKPFSKKTICEVIKELVNLNPNILIDDYYLNMIK